MAYDRYARDSDNPWRIDIDTLDMPRARPTARPGAGRVAAAAAPTPKKKKKKPAVPLPPRRPAGLGARDVETVTPADLDPVVPDVEPIMAPDRNPAMPPERPFIRPSPTIATPNVDAVLPGLEEPPPIIPPRGAPRMTPRVDATLPRLPINSGLLQQGPMNRPNLRQVPENARRAMGGIFDTGPVMPPRPGEGTPLTTKPGGLFDTGPVTPMQMPDMPLFIRQLLGRA